MARHSRIVIPGIAHHITQRGNRQEQVFYCDEDRHFFLNRLNHYASRAHLGLAAYCLMDNHSHIIGIPEREDSLWRTFKPLHMCYSQWLNRKLKRTGINWQGRFYSSPMDEMHTRAAFKYVALNPVRAKMVERAEDFPWSSASFHQELSTNSYITAGPEWVQLAHEAMKDLEGDQNGSAPDPLTNKIEKYVLRNLPLGAEAFVSALESKLGRNLRWRPHGRPRKNAK